MQFASINGISIHYQVVAAPDDKPTIVFSNSLGTDFRIWRDVIVRLIGECSIVLYDKRGHGLSGMGETGASIEDHAADLAGLIDHLGLSGVVVCGLSVGGLIAQMLVRERPDLVAGLILCDTGAKIGDDDTWNARIAMAQEGGLDALADGTMERWFTADFQATDALAGYRAMFARQPVEGFIDTSTAIRDCDLRADALNIAVPSICIVGEDDRATPPELMIALAKLIPDCRYETIKNAGHLPCVEQPEMLVEVMKAYLKDAGLVGA